MGLERGVVVEDYGLESHVYESKTNHGYAAAFSIKFKCALRFVSILGVLT